MEERVSTQTTREWKERAILAFTSVLFLGYVPVASGTVGSLPAVGLAVLLGSRPALLLGIASILFVLGVRLSARAETLLGRTDPGEIVIDEFVGMLVAFLWLPITGVSVTVVFLLFRVFDIVKPFPARRCERMAGGLGVMADDIVAGIYANLVVRVALLFF
jgi:phosphatidylglycerophosphatase A